MKQKYFTRGIYLALIFILCVACLQASEESINEVAPTTKVKLGERLFFDNILSSDYSLNCGSCHIPASAFADTVAISIGVGGEKGKRNTPSVMNMFFRDSLFWDGRANDLASQVVFPIEDPHEMNLPFREAIKRIQESEHYIKWFTAIYKKAPDSLSIIDAIVQYEKSLETEDTPNDRWLNDEEPSGMTAQMIRGRELFTSDRTRCFDCHFTPDFTSDEFKNIGLFNGKELNDSGRYVVTKNPDDIGRFKIPGLRNVAITAPYMHNGMFQTLREVIDYYDEPSKFVDDAIGIDTILPAKIGLTENEKNDLEAFLHSLTDDRFSSFYKK